VRTRYAGEDTTFRKEGTSNSIPIKAIKRLFAAFHAKAGFNSPYGSTPPELPKLRRWSYERQAMPPVTKGQSGQVHDDRSLSVPQLSASATADGFES